MSTLKPNEIYRIEQRKAYHDLGIEIAKRHHMNITEVSLTLRKYQLDTLKNLIENVYAEKSFHHVDLPFGAGKTRIACAYIKCALETLRPEDSKILVVVPDATMKAWIEELKLWGITYFEASDYDSNFNSHLYPGRFYTAVQKYYWNPTDEQIIRSPESQVLRHVEVVLLETSKFEAYCKYQTKDSFSLLVWDDFDTSPAKLEDSINRFTQVMGLSATFKMDPGISDPTVNEHKYFRYTADATAIEESIAIASSVNLHTIYYKISERINEVFQGTEFQNLFRNGNYAEALACLGTKNIESIADLIEYVTSSYAREIESISREDPSDARIATLKAKIEMVKSRVAENMKACSICSNDFNPDLVDGQILCGKCQICFHKECILEWYSVAYGYPKCPFCKTDIVNESMISLQRAPTVVEPPADAAPAAEEPLVDAAPPPMVHPNHTSAVIAAIREVAVEAAVRGIKPRLLLVNGSEKNTDDSLIKAELPDLKIGNIYQDRDMIDKYRSGEIDVINLHSWKDCAGLHIPETTHIIITTPVSDSARQQIIHRGHRVGSVDDTYVVNLVMRDN